MEVKWCIQKNRRNEQTLQIMAELDHPDICPVRNASQLILRQQQLKHPMALPLEISRNKSGDVKYFTASKIDEVIRQVLAGTAQPDLTDVETQKFSAHSIRVWAYVLLSKAGMKSDFIKSHLRWMGESYRTYLCDTDKINNQHLTAPTEASSEVMKLLINSMENLSIPDEIEEDLEMGEYTDTTS